MFNYFNIHIFFVKTKHYLNICWVIPSCFFFFLYFFALLATRLQASETNWNYVFLSNQIKEKMNRNRKKEMNKTEEAKKSILV